MTELCARCGWEFSQGGTVHKVKDHERTERQIRICEVCFNTNSRLGGDEANQALHTNLILKAIRDSQVQPVVHHVNPPGPGDILIACPHCRKVNMRRGMRHLAQTAAVGQKLKFNCVQCSNAVWVINYSGNIIGACVEQPVLEESVHVPS